jgi:hypothetical protein
MSRRIYNAISAEVKLAMKARTKDRLGALRLMLAEVQRVEVDERVEVDDDRALIILDKMSKQRKDSLKQFEEAGREDLARQEALEIAVIDEFLPDRLNEEEVLEVIKVAISDTGASSMGDMGKVMALVKTQVQGRADMASVSTFVKSLLS